MGIHILENSHGKPQGTQIVIHMNDAVVRVDVAGWNPKDDRRNPLLVELECTGVGGPTSSDRHLVWDTV